MTATFPFCVRKATSRLPRIRLERGFSKSPARQNKYQEAGYAGKELTAGGGAGMPGLTESRLLLRLLMSKPGISDAALMMLAGPTLDNSCGKDKPSVDN